MSLPAVARPWQVLPEGLRLAVRLTPRGGKDALGKIEILADGRPVLTARVRAAPTDGEANQALAGLIAGVLKVPVSRVTISQGVTSRVKTLLVEGNGTLLEKSILAAIG